MTAQARRYLTELERERDALRNYTSPQAELPLFARPAAAAAPENPPPWRRCARSIPTALSPREALDLLFRLKSLDRDATR